MFTAYSHAENQKNRRVSSQRTHIPRLIPLIEYHRAYSSHHLTHSTPTQHQPNTTTSIETTTQSNPIYPPPKPYHRTAQHTTAHRSPTTPHHPASKPHHLPPRHHVRAVRAPAYTGVVQVRSCICLPVHALKCEDEASSGRVSGVLMPVHVHGHLGIYTPISPTGTAIATVTVT